MTNQQFKNLQAHFFAATPAAAPPSPPACARLLYYHILNGQIFMQLHIYRPQRHTEVTSESFHSKKLRVNLVYFATFCSIDVISPHFFKHRVSQRSHLVQTPPPRWSTPHFQPKLSDSFTYTT